MKLTYTEKSNLYIVKWSNLSFIKSKHKSFKTILAALEFACGQMEYLESMSPVFIDYAIKYKHRIIHKMGFAEFC